MCVCVCMCVCMCMCLCAYSNILILSNCAMLDQ